MHIDMGESINIDIRKTSLFRKNDKKYFTYETIFGIIVKKEKRFSISK